jgi:antitoxin ParD1/3/4
MGTDVNLTPDLERFAQDCVESGRFNNVSEVVRSGPRLLQDAEQKRAAFVASLDAAVAEGHRDGFVSLADVESRALIVIDAARARNKGMTIFYPKPSGNCKRPWRGSPTIIRS